ncbi:MAG TPA: CRISPR-associated protein [Planktothrix sp. UBA10369]|nr:CRISPR-associated protein [Planktothrix sp. UBA10369]
MPTNYLYGTILTGEAVAANNRGDNLGNTTTLQKVFHQDTIHTSVSAEAIRFALRYRFQLENPDLVNRSYDANTSKLEHKDEKITYWNSNSTSATKNNQFPSANYPYIDDDLMGFMDAEAAGKEKEAELQEEETTSKKPKEKLKGKVTKRQSPLAIGRAISLRPYRGELSFNCVSGEKSKGQLSLYNAEMHTTEYQYSFGINLGDVIQKEYIGQLIDAIIDPPPVAGNHARFAYDFSPASIIFRLTHAHSSRIQNCFEHDEINRTYTLERLIERLKAKDIPPTELVIGGEIYATEEGEILKNLGVTVYRGVYEAAQEIRQQIAMLGDGYQVLGG